MCDQSGDIEGAAAGLLYNVTVNIDKDGHVMGDNNNHNNIDNINSPPSEYFTVANVLECVGCELPTVLPLIGHGPNTMDNNINNNNNTIDHNFVPYSDTLVKMLAAAGGVRRAPGMFLVKRAAKLYCVVIDHQGVANIVGQIGLVLPHVADDDDDEDGDNKGKLNVLRYRRGDKNNKIKLSLECSDRIDLKAALNAHHLGIVALNGQLVLQTATPDDDDDDDDDDQELVLLLANSYLLLEGVGQLCWLRKDVHNKDGNGECARSAITKTEVFITQRGVLMPDEEPNNNGMLLVGTGTAIVPTNFIDNLTAH